MKAKTFTIRRWIAVWLFVVSFGLVAPFGTAIGATVGWGLNETGQASPPLPPTNLVSIAGGAKHSVGLTPEGKVVAWGDNAFGQCSVPAGLSNVVAVSAGALHSLALRDDGTVVAWGDNGSGQISVPVGLGNVRAVSAGGFVSMALRGDGSAAVWGESAFGQTVVPVGATNLKAIAAGSLHCLGLRSNGTVVAWGENSSRQIDVPSAATGVVAIVAGRSHSLALRSNGSVLSWGAATPAPPSLNGVSSIAAGYAHSLALRTNGVIVSWGINGHGQVATPPGLSNVAAIASGGYHNLALVSAPYIVAQPMAFMTTAGGDAIFAVSALSGSALTYQWFRGGEPVAEATNGTLVLTNVGANQAGVYYVKVSNSAGQVLSANAALQVVPVISEQPADKTVAAGSDVGFAVAANGPLPLSYRWRLNGVDLPNETGSSLSLTNVEADRAGEYRVVVAMSSGSVTSAPAVLAVTTSCVPAPGGLIGWWKADSDVLNFAGEAQASFPGAFQPGKVGKSFSVALSEQVAVADRPFLNPTNAITVEAWVLYTDAPYSFMSVVTKGDGNSLSQYAVHKLRDGRFYVGVDTLGGGSLAYGTTSAQSGRWYHVALTYDADGSIRLYVNGVLEAENPANGPILASDYPLLMGVNFAGLVDEPSIYNRALDTAEILAIYRADSAGKCASPLSPTVVSVPDSQTVVAGSDINLSVEVVGTAPLFYQWQHNGSVLPGATNSGLGLANFQALDSGVYRLIASNAIGAVTSAPVALSIQSSGPVITLQPAFFVGLVDHPAKMEVSFLGSQPLEIQWMFENQRVTGATNRILSLPGLALSNTGGYSVVLSNAQGSVTSIVAQLAVLQSPVPAPALRGWGDNSNGQLNFTSRTTNLVAVACSEVSTLGLRSDGIIVASSEGATGQISLPQLSNDVVAVEISEHFGLALRSDGTVAAWGSNPNGELDVPADLTNVVALAAAKNSATALKLDGTVVGWGGAGGAPPAGLSNIVALSSGQNGTLALKSDGSLVGWGLPSPISPIPQGLTGIKAIAVGASHCVVLRSNGTVVAWGMNTYGQTNVPIELNDVAAIAAGANHCVALRSNGRVVAWGDNGAGQCLVPTGLSNVVAIAAGGAFSVAATRAPSLYKQPASITTTRGADVSFAVAAAGDGPLSYQWQKDGADLVGATDDLLTMANVQTNQSGVYSVRVSSPFGFAESIGAVLQVGLPHPAEGGVIVDNSAAQVVGDWLGSAGGQRYGPDFLFNSEGNGAGRVTFVPDLPQSGGYQVFEWHPKSAAKSALHFIAFDGGQQSVSVDQTTNGGKWNLLGVFKFGAGTSGSVGISDLVPQSASATLSADAVSFVYVPPPVIVAQPLAQTVSPGGTAQFSVDVISQTPVSYQWRYQGLDLSDSTNGTLMVSNVQASNAGDYSVAVSNISGIAHSSIARLAVGFQLGLEVSGSSMSLNWTGDHQLQSSTNVAGPYGDVSGSSPHVVDPAAKSEMFFRLRSK